MKTTMATETRAWFYLIFWFSQDTLTTFPLVTDSLQLVQDVDKQSKTEFRPNSIFGQSVSPSSIGGAARCPQQLRTPFHNSRGICPCCNAFSVKFVFMLQTLPPAHIGYTPVYAETGSFITPHPPVSMTPSFYPLFSCIIDSFVHHSPSVTYMNLNFNFASTSRTLL